MFSKLVRWNPSSIAKWEEIRAAGRRRYVWRIGVLGWGGFMFLVMTPFVYVQRHGFDWPSVDEIPIVLIAFSALIWLVAGYWFGATMWATMEKAYLRLWATAKSRT